MDPCIFAYLGTSVGLGDCSKIKEFEGGDNLNNLEIHLVVWKKLWNKSSYIRLWTC